MGVIWARLRMALWGHSPQELYACSMMTNGCKGEMSRRFCDGIVSLT